MTPDPVLDLLRRFLREHVATYEELEVLLLLARARRAHDRGRTLESVAEALVAATDDCRLALDSLVARGLVKVEPGSMTFRYEPAADDVEQTVELLEQTYREQRATVVMMMSANAVERVRTSAIRTFAEAFRLKGPKK